MIRGIALFTVVAILAFIANFYYYTFTFFLRQQGVKTSYFWGLFHDLQDFIQIIRNEPDRKKKRHYQHFLIGLLISQLLFSLGGFLMMFIFFAGA